MVFSPVDSLNKAILKLEGVNVPAAKYSFVWSGQNAMEDTIPICPSSSAAKCRGENLVNRCRVFSPFKPSFAFFEGVV